MDIATHPIVFYMFGLPIKDTVVMTWIMMGIIIITMLLIRRFKPGLLEILLEFILDLIRDVLYEDNLIPYLPLLGSLFIFILFANILSVVPGLKSPTSDINTTLALGLIVFFAVHFFGIRKKGFWGYITTFSSPIYLFPLEIVGQLSRTLSLTIRLFGNIVSSDLIVAIVFSLIPVIAPIPLIALSLIIGVLQAYVFTILASLYIASAVEINIEEAQIKEVKKLQKMTP